jgi:hypothetical protein
VEAVANNQVILVAGETGCGKTTQVPQYLLENAWGELLQCIWVCTLYISKVRTVQKTEGEKNGSVWENAGSQDRLLSKLTANLQVFVKRSDKSCIEILNYLVLKMPSHEHILTSNQFAHAKPARQAWKNSIVQSRQGLFCPDTDVRYFALKRD